VTSERYRSARIASRRTTRKGPGSLPAPPLALRVVPVRARCASRAAPTCPPAWLAGRSTRPAAWTGSGAETRPAGPAAAWPSPATRPG